MQAKTAELIPVLQMGCLAARAKILCAQAALPSCDCDMLTAGLVCGLQAGDAIWMAPYVPQWYAALGTTDSRYILYKDTTVDPIYA